PHPDALPLHDALPISNRRDIMVAWKATETVTRSGVISTNSPAQERKAGRETGSGAPRSSTGSVLISFSSSTLLAGPLTSTSPGVDRKSTRLNSSYQII